MLILNLHYFGECAKLFFRTTGVFYILLILLALFQANGIAFFVAQLFTDKVFKILSVAFGFTPANTYQFSLLIAFCFAVVYEFLVAVLSRNGRQKEAYAFTGLVVMLSFASYLQIFKDTVPFLVFGLDVMLLAPLMVAALPPIGSLILAEGLINRSLSFAALSGMLVTLETGFAEAKGEIRAARGNGKRASGGGQKGNFQMPNNNLNINRAS